MGRWGWTAGVLLLTAVLMGTSPAAAEEHGGGEAAAPAEGGGHGGGSGGEGASKGKDELPPRSAAATMPGDYIQLGPIWVAQEQGGGSPTYVPVMVRLYPAEGKKLEACYAAPRVLDVLIRRMGRQTFSRDAVMALAKEGKRLAEIANEASDATAAASVWAKAEAFPGHAPELDPDSAELTKVCK